MKVLMFGWEFPPHISGGLGTACYGLTHSLGKADVDVLFVVPKLYGDEPAQRISLINASGVKIKSAIRTRSSKKHSGATQAGSGIPTYRTSSGETIAPTLSKGFTYIEVPSGLTAYRSPDFETMAQPMEHWNYEVNEFRRTQGSQSPTSLDEDQSADIRSDQVNSDTLSKAQSESETHTEQEITYAFSGSYGSDLLTEVQRYAEVAAEIAKQFSFDVIHAHDWMTYPAGLAAKEVSGKPLVVHVHATEYDRSGEQVNTRVHAIETQGMQQADRVITVSEWTKKIAITKYKVSKEKIEVVHNGIVPSKINTSFFKSPLKKKVPIVTFLGRITHQKGPLYFVEAARRVLEVMPDAHFVVAGAGDLLPTMIQRVAQLKMSSHFHFTGFLKGKDIDKIWSVSNVYVMPSVSEPFGIAPLEAIQAGVPVIISKQSGVAEVMPHAITVDFWNTQALASAICGVLKYKSLHKTLKKNSEAEIKNITWDKAAKKINNLYHELITHP